MMNNSIQFAACYIRVSTEDQAEFSPGAQKKALLKYASANGYAVEDANIFVDEGISGRKAEKRPAFMNMIAKAKSKDRPFDVILVHKFDRFARSREDSVVYKSLLKKECGVKVISITESIEDDKFSIILEAMLEAMAEYYSINLSEEVKKGMTEKAHRGGLQALPSFGYTVKDNVLVPIESEAAIVREIFSRFINGEGYYPIAKWINSLGVKTHRGNPFEHRTVEYIIRNPVYIGRLRWNPDYNITRSSNNESLIIAEAKHEPIIDMQTWEAAECRAAEVKVQWKYHGRPTAEYKDWISGIVRCAECGNTLVFSQSSYLKCNGYIKGKCKVSQHVRADILKKSIIGKMAFDAAFDDDIQYTAIRSSSGIDEISALEARRDRLIKSKDRLREAFLAGVETVDEYGESRKLIEDEVAGIDERITKLQIDRDEINIKESLQTAISEALNILESPKKTISEKHYAILNIINSCIFDKTRNELTILYRCFS